MLGQAALLAGGPRGEGRYCSGPCPALQHTIPIYPCCPSPPPCNPCLPSPTRLVRQSLYDELVVFNPLTLPLPATLPHLCRPLYCPTSTGRCASRCTTSW